MEAAAECYPKARWQRCVVQWYRNVFAHVPRGQLDAALAHVVQNKAEAAYARSDLFERRRMDDWAAHLAAAVRRR